MKIDAMYFPSVTHEVMSAMSELIPTGEKRNKQLKNASDMLAPEEYTFDVVFRNR